MNVHSNLCLLLHKQIWLQGRGHEVVGYRVRAPELDASTSQHAVFEELDSEHILSLSGSGIACGSLNLPMPSNVNIMPKPDC